jgi:hypothetical protein
MHPKNIMAKIQITPGELADRISILEIKREKSYHDKDELYELQREWESFGIGRSYINDLKKINLESWDVVQKIYELFDEGLKFGAYAEAALVSEKAHHLNKQRVTLKNYINKSMGVDRQEIKTWRV